jgi:hypothetical protein
MALGISGEVGGAGGGMMAGCEWVVEAALRGWGDVGKGDWENSSIDLVLRIDGGRGGEVIRRNFGVESPSIAEVLSVAVAAKGCGRPYWEALDKS